MTTQEFNNWIGGLPLKKRLWKYAQRITNGQYIVDNGNREALAALCHAVEGESIGVLLFGAPGAGKTEIFKMIQKVTYPPFHPKRMSRVDCIDITASFSKDGYDALAKYEKKTIIFDDLGREKEGKHYGSTENLMERIICKRYDLFVSSGIVTHYTTNFTPEELSQRYSPHVVSRLMATCIAVEVKGQRRTDNQWFKQEYPEIYPPYCDGEPDSRFLPENYTYTPSEPREPYYSLRERLGNVQPGMLDSYNLKRIYDVKPE